MNDRLRLHDHQGGTSAGPIPGERRPEETVGWLRSSARALTGEHGELWAKGLSSTVVPFQGVRSSIMPLTIEVAAFRAQKR